MKALHATLSVVLLLTAAVSSPLADVWYIKSDGTGDAPTIQAGMDSAMVGDTVMLAAGTFTGAGNRSLNFHGKAIVVTSESGAGVTTVDCEGTAFGFYLNSNEGNGSRITNLTIYGATYGIYAYGGSPWVEGCVITACTYGIRIGDFDDEITYYSSVRIIGGTIDNNGTGIHVRESGSVNATNTTISNNGTGVSAESSVTLSGCSLSSNDTGVRFAVGFTQSGSFVDCTFVDHTNGAIIDYFADSHVNGCTFVNNHASNGGAISFIAESPRIENSIFMSNSASVNGGAIWGQIGSTTTLARITGNIFCQNTATRDGGAVYLDAAVAELRKNTFSENNSRSAAVHLDGTISTGTVSENILAFSTRGDGIACTNGANPTLICNDIYGNAGGDALCGTDGGNNFSLDPLFCGILGSGNYELRSDSPCAPANSPCGTQVGARPVGCGTVPVLFAGVGAAANDDYVEIRWEITTDEVIEGFRVLRANENREIGVAGLQDLPSTARSYRDGTARPGETYTYTVVAVTKDGDEYRSQRVEVHMDVRTTALFQNHPNPFNPSTTIRYRIDTSGPVALAIFDVSGRLVRTLIDEFQAPRSDGYTVTWSGRNDSGRPVSSGVYFYRLRTEGRIYTKRMVLLK